MPQIIHNYRDDEPLRQKLFELIDSVYPWADFRTWYELGYWSDAYVPYSILEDDRIVSNVSISIMEVLLNGERIKAAQIGTVGTLKDYRGRGYSKLLMDKVLSDYESRVDIIFLYANEDVVEFYPKFGFVPAQESIFISRRPVLSSERLARQLSVASETDRTIVQRLLEESLPLTKRFGAVNHQFVFFWHWINIFPHDVNYLEEEDVVLITKEKDGCLRLFGVLSKQPLEIDHYLSRIMRSENVNKIEYYFPPDVHSFIYNEVLADDSLLFVRGNFPRELSEFKLPTTAQT